MLGQSRLDWAINKGCRLCAVLTENSSEGKEGGNGGRRGGGRRVQGGHTKVQRYESSVELSKSGGVWPGRGMLCDSHGKDRRHRPSASGAATLPLPVRPGAACYSYSTRGAKHAPLRLLSTTPLSRCRVGRELDCSFHSCLRLLSDGRDRDTLVSPTACCSLLGRRSLARYSMATHQASQRCASPRSSQSGPWWTVCKQPIYSHISRCNRSCGYLAPSDAT